MWTIHQITSCTCLCMLGFLNKSKPRQNGRRFAGDILKLIFSKEDLWISVIMIFHWSLFLRVTLTIFQHWFRLWLVTLSVPSHYLNQSWNIVHPTLRSKIQWNLNQNLYIFIKKNAIENVFCEMWAILTQPQLNNTKVVNMVRYRPVTIDVILLDGAGGLVDDDARYVPLEIEAFLWMQKPPKI